MNDKGGENRTQPQIRHLLVLDISSPRRSQDEFAGLLRRLPQTLFSRIPQPDYREGSLAEGNNTPQVDTDSNDRQFL
jgi:hypothetical protein